uniref:Putative basic tail protein n=1 Tax=Ixodes ricinus TaxID=34613 RepID=A0A0K8R4C7_IXORI
MELNAFTILQIAVFIAVGYHANTHSTVAGSKLRKATSDPNSDLYVSYCGTNCTVLKEVSSQCSEDCTCVHVGNEPNGICIEMIYFGHLGDPGEDPSIDDAAPRAAILHTKD